MDNNQRRLCASSSEKLEESINKQGMKLPAGGETPMSYNYKPEFDATAKTGYKRYHYVSRVNWIAEMGHRDS